MERESVYIFVSLMNHFVCILYNIRRKIQYSQTLLVSTWVSKYVFVVSKYSLLSPYLMQYH